MQYTEAIKKLQEMSKFGVNLGLERIRELLRRMGNPEKDLRVIHVGGTNGKGWVSAMIAAILTAAGQKTGFFSSPHLDSYTERFRINGQEITESELAALLSEILPHIEAMIAEGFEPPTEFEVSTALAISYFAQSKVDWAVLEVGMGGAIDSTNVADGEIAVITNVALDHMEYLGDTITEIAAVKAGIIKPHAAVFTAADGEALAIIKNKAQEVNAHLIEISGTSCREIGADVSGTKCDIAVAGRVLKNVFIPLLGEHQMKNAALAVAAAIHAGADDDTVYQGLSQVKWPARLEIIGENPLVVIDGAHNVHGMKALAAALTKYWPHKKIIAVLGMLADKEREKALTIILPHIAEAIIARPDSDRAGDWQILADLCAKHGVPARLFENIGGACVFAKSLAEPEDMILVTGSLYLVAEARIQLTISVQCPVTSG
jgi:dihydrofolate synthase/folylpolyglutamate synthase